MLSTFWVRAGVSISTGGKGQWMDDVFIERLWRLLKWECVSLREPEPAVMLAERSETGFASTTNSIRMQLLTVAGLWTYNGKAIQPQRWHDHQPD